MPKIIDLSVSVSPKGNLKVKPQIVYRTHEELLGAIHRIAASQALRDELGEKGYRAFIEHWSREAHLKLYFDFLRGAATHKFGYVPWER